MLKQTLCLSLGLFSVCLFQNVTAAESAPIDRSKQYNDHPAYNFHGEIDNTDIYAIQLDRSEEEQNEEINEFDKESKEYLEAQKLKGKK